MDQQKLERTMLFIMRLLVAGEYRQLEEVSAPKGLTAQQMQKSVEEWPFRLVMPPDHALTSLISISGDVADTSPQEWWVELRAWTQEESASDLELQVSVYDNLRELYDIEIRDLHVM